MLIKSQIILFLANITFVCCAPQNFKEKRSPQEEWWNTATPSQDETVKNKPDGNSGNLEFSQNPISSTLKNSFKNLEFGSNDSKYIVSNPTASNNNYTLVPPNNITPVPKDQTNINVIVYSSRDSTSNPTKNNDFEPSPISDHFQLPPLNSHQSSPPHRHWPPPHYDDRRPPSHPPFSRPHYRWPPPPPPYGYRRPPYESWPPSRYYDEFSYHRRTDSYGQRGPSNSFYDRSYFFPDDGRGPPADRRLNQPGHGRGPPPSYDWRPPPPHRIPLGPPLNRGPPPRYDYGHYSPPNHRPFPPSANRPPPPDHRPYPIDQRHAPMNENLPHPYKSEPNSDNDGINTQLSFPPRVTGSESTIPVSDFNKFNIQIENQPQVAQPDNQVLIDIFGTNPQANKSQRAILTSDDNSPNSNFATIKHIPRIFQVLPVTPEM